MLKCKNTAQKIIIMYFVHLFLLCSCTYSELLNRPQPTRIIGGTSINITEAPYQLGLEYIWERFYCGAAIIHRSWAITAAHCVEGRPNFLLRLRSGSSYVLKGGVLHKIRKIIIHPDFKNINKDFDVAVLKVLNPFHFSDVAQKIPMATTTPTSGTPAVVSGWGSLKYGKTAAVHLQEVTVYIREFETCKQIYKRFTPRMLCAGDIEGGRDACQGDSGGPLVFNKKLVGIVSWGIDCGQQDYPGVYTDVANVRSWVTSNIKKKTTYH